MDVIANPLSLTAIGGAGDSIQAASFALCEPDGREVSAEWEAAVGIAEQAMERAFHMTGVAAYLEYYEM